MATIHNTDLTKELKDGAKLQQLRDIVPSQLADKVVPVMEVNPRLLRRDRLLGSLNANITSASTAVLMAADSGRDTYITGIYFNLFKDATCDVASAVKSITCTIDGATANILLYPIITLTAQSWQIYIQFLHPIKIDLNTQITTNAFAYTAGTAYRCIDIYGYKVDNINA